MTKQINKGYKNIYCPVCKKITRQVKNIDKDYYVCNHSIGKRDKF